MGDTYLCRRLGSRRDEDNTANLGFVKELLRRSGAITTVVQNINDRNTSMVLGKDNETLYGPGRISDTLCGLSFLISPGAFYQVNPVQTEALYGTAMDFAALTGEELVV
ncbi:MAG: hypothetical protein IKA60_04690, partial [Rikenellaceae bacterium]|nr:hypothetical protein [Rikenellaceae bacterium]